MTTGEKIAKERKEQHYTQEQLAELLGVTRQSISKWESDVAFPEMEKLVKMSTLFSCSMDYLLKDDVTERTSAPAPKKAENSRAIAPFSFTFRERKSEKTIRGMPLYHIAKDAHGFFAVGLRAKGVFSVGLLSRGVVSLGLLSFGLIAFGTFSMGLIALGALAVGLFAIGAIALGILALGAIAVGIVTVGAISVGCFSLGALAIGKYAAMGDHAKALIAIGKTRAEGTLASFSIDTPNTERIRLLLDEHTPPFLAWAKWIFLHVFL